MRKTFLCFILPAVFTLFVFTVFSVVFVLKNKSFTVSADQQSVLIFVGLMLVICLLQIIFFTWKFMYKTGGEIEKISSVAKKFNDGSFAQRFSYQESTVPDIEGLRKVLNNLVSKVEKKVVKLQLQVNEKMAVLSSMKEAVIAVNLSEKVYILSLIHI